MAKKKATKKRSKPKKPVKGKGVWPLSADVEAEILALQSKNKGLVTVGAVERSVEGRPIYAVAVTDPRVKPKDKEHVLVVGGQHGNEESGRMVALALIRWLCTKAAKETVRRQKIVVMPNVNPDGAEYDIHGDLDGVHPNLDHEETGPKTPEGRALENVSKAFRPDVFVDLHACGGAGCGTDMVLYPWPKPYSEDARLLALIAEDMCAAGEKAGVPQTTFPMTWSGWGGPGMDGGSSTKWHYRNFKSIVILTENTEHNEHSYSVQLRTKSGLDKLKALLKWGNRRHPKLPYEGYPCMLACSMFDRGVVALGDDPESRRESRIAIWRNAGAFAHLGCRNPQEESRKILHVDYGGETLRSGAAFQTCFAGHRKVKSVKVNGRPLASSIKKGYHSWTAGTATYVMAAMPVLRPGKYDIEMVMR